MKNEFISTHRKIMIAIITAMFCFLTFSAPLALTRGLTPSENFLGITLPDHNLWEDSTTPNLVTSDTWSQQAKLAASDGAFLDQFGASVSISGDTQVVGARYDNNNQGSAYVFEKPVDGWTDMTETAKLTASDGTAQDQFGCAVAISGDIVVIGAPGNDGSQGAAYVYKKPVGGWTDMTETAKLIASDGAAFDDFGFSVAISGDTVMVGAVDDTLTYVFQGSAYVFVRPVDGWINMNQTAKLTASDGAAEDYFGASVTIDGDTVVVGAPGADITNGTTIYDVGRAYVFEKPVDGWTDMTETAKLTASDGEANDDFGASMGISGDTVAIGAWGNDGYIGAAYIFGKPVGGWTDITETAKLTASDGIPYDDFGYSVAISLDTVVAGAHLDDDHGNSSGSAYVFTGYSVQEPLPDIKANGSDGPVTISVSDTLSVTVALDPGIYPGYQADWWCVADVPFPPWWYYYDAGTETWLPGFKVSYQGPLFELTPPSEVLNISDLPSGNYTFYFGVDGWCNGKLDVPYLYYDSVEVNITP